MTIDLSGVRQSFVRTHTDRHRTLSDIARRLPQAADPGQAIQEAVCLLHTISGTAETLGFGELGRKARDAEAAGEAVLRGGNVAAGTLTFRRELTEFLAVSGRVCR